MYVCARMRTCWQLLLSSPTTSANISVNWAPSKFLLQRCKLVKSTNMMEVIQESPSAEFARCQRRQPVTRLANDSAPCSARQADRTDAPPAVERAGWDEVCASVRALNYRPLVCNTWGNTSWTHMKVNPADYPPTYLGRRRKNVHQNCQVFFLVFF